MGVRSVAQELTEGGVVRRIGSAGCLGAVLTALSIGVAPAEATWPGGNGRIYFEQGANGYSLSATGTDLRSESAIAPGFSLNLAPDGATAAFSNGQTAHPVLAKLDGSSSMDIGSWFGGSAAVGVAPDGQHVDGLYTKSSGQWALRQTDLSGATVHDFGFGAQQTTTCQNGSDTFWDRATTIYTFGGMSLRPDGQILVNDDLLTGSCDGNGMPTRSNDPYLASVDPATGAISDFLHEPHSSSGNSTYYPVGVSPDGSEFVDFNDTLVCGNPNCTPVSDQDQVIRSLERRTAGGSLIATVLSANSVNASDPGYDVPVEAAAYSPDGTKLVYEDTHPNVPSSALHVVDLNGGSQTDIPLAGTANSIQWNAVPAPTVTIVDGPVNETTGSTTAQFAFTVNGNATGGYECRVDAGSFEACVSPKSYGGLSDGVHHFYVRFVPTGGIAGPITSASWQVDLTPPVVTIDAAPSGDNEPPDATIVFHANEARSTFVCSLDGQPTEPCASPWVLTGLSAERHGIGIVATDPYGNRSATATAAWTVGSGMGGVNVGPCMGCSGTESPSTINAPITCPDQQHQMKSVPVGNLVALALSPASCFTSVQNGKFWQSPGPVAINGVIVTPDPGGHVTLSGTVQGGLFKTDSPADFNFGLFSARASDTLSFPDLVSAGTHVLIPGLLHELLTRHPLKLGGLGIEPTVDAEISRDTDGGSISLQVGLALPKFFTAGPTSGVNIFRSSANEQPIAVQGGIKVSNERGAAFVGKLQIPTVYVGPLQIESATLGFDGTAHSFDGSATLRLEPPEGPKFTVAASFAPVGLPGLGPLKSFSILADALNRPLGASTFFLQRLGGGISQTVGSTTGALVPQFTGTLGFSWLPHANIPVLGETEVLSLDGGFTWTFDTDSVLQVGPATGKLLGFPITDAGVSYSNGVATITGRMGIDAGIFAISDDLVGSYIDAPHSDFNFEEDRTTTVDDRTVRDQYVASTTGLAICFTETGKPSFGFTRPWGGSFNPVGSGCDVGPYVRVQGTALPAQVDVPHPIDVTAGQKLLVLSIAGASASPHVALELPGGGQDAQGDQTRMSGAGQALFAPDPSHHATAIVLYDPPAGHYAITTLPGSVPITAISRAYALPTPRVTGHLSRQGVRATLAYQEKPIAGQAVRFVERAAHLSHPLATTSSRRGRLRFTPAEATDRARTIVAQVIQNGALRTTLTVAHFTIPTGRPRIAAARVRGRRLTWKALDAARTYVAFQNHSGKIVGPSIATDTTSIRVPKGAAFATLTPQTGYGRLGTPIRIRIGRRHR